jgi:hypothetical protein
MSRLRRILGLAAGICAMLLSCAAGYAQSILTYHNDGARTGLYVMPRLTWQRAGAMHLDPDFDGRIEGHIYAQPLFWQDRQTGRKLIIVATEDDVVYGLDVHDGKVAWRKSLGRPVPRSALPRGNIGPLGITGTPVIDDIKCALYVDAWSRPRMDQARSISSSACPSATALCFPAFPRTSPKRSACAA